MFCLLAEINILLLLLHINFVPNLGVALYMKQLARVSEQTPDRNM